MSDVFITNLYNMNKSLIFLSILNQILYVNQQHKIILGIYTLNVINLIIQSLAKSYFFLSRIQILK
jgi:threonine/homoserine/homoserine lactone efflux protein